MDGDDYNVFSEAELPVSEIDVAKPSKDFIVNLITAFFNKFHIDGYLIKQPTQEQLDSLVFQDRELYDELIKLINMHVAMSGIFEKIFVKDFQLIDITSPSPKKTKKLTKFLANFVLYYRNKLSEIEGSVNDIVHRREKIDQLISKKRDALEKIARSKAYRQDQSVYNEKLRKEIEEVRKRTEKITTGMGEKKEQVRLLEQDRQKVAQVYGDKKSEALEVTNKTAGIQAQVVESPEGLEAQLRDLEKQKDFKTKERELKYDSIKEKKKLVERRESIQDFIHKEAEKLTQVKKLHQEKTKVAKQLESVKKELEEIQDAILKLEKDREIQESHCSASEIEELNLQVETRLAPLRDQAALLSIERKDLDAKFKHEQEKHREVVSHLNRVLEEITTLERETCTFLKQCQELYNNEISEDLQLRKIFEGFFKK
ncbi:probable kinetochore protein nuf2 [Belonocnema kinseyi]|uniref:probable kinetochore protein nuf2 n=1 Tax=Belonocnema kinseyi TaxID=2817044 RepID=UPI00143D5F5E|nr:probable kinetochore protein nuf2 [Belonocnema kinseyi]